MRRFCGNCGTEQENLHQDFCQKCGAPFDRWNKANLDLDAGQESWGTVGAAKSRLSALKLSDRRKFGFGISGTFFGIIIVIILSVIVGGNFTARYGTIHQITEGTQATSKQAKYIADIMQQCGISKVNSIKVLDRKDKESVYKVVTPETNQVLLYLNTNLEVKSITCYGHALYQDHKLIALQKDYVVLKTEENAFRKGAMQAINKVLNLDKHSATYPSAPQWRITQDENGIYVQSYVEYEQASKKTIRKNFKITCSPDKSKIVKIQIDGKTYQP